MQIDKRRRNSARKCLLQKSVVGDVVSLVVGDDVRGTQAYF
jgi:hypothetical protein